MVSEVSVSRGGYLTLFYIYKGELRGNLTHLLPHPHLLKKQAGIERNSRLLALWAHNDAIIRSFTLLVLINRVFMCMKPNHFRSQMRKMLINRELYT